MVTKYELPDELLQLIAASPEIAAPMMQQGGEAQFATPDVRRSDLISALRGISGPGNPGFTRFANKGNGSMAAMRNYRGANNPGVLSMGKYVAPEVVLPGGETSTPYVRPKDLVVDSIVNDDIVDDGDWPGDYVEDYSDDGDKGVAATDDGFSPDIPVGTVITDGSVDTIVGGTGNDTVTGGTGDGTRGGTGGGGTGGGDGGSGTGGTGTGGGTGTTGTGSVGTATTGTNGTESNGTGDSLRDAITAAIDGAGASIDNSTAGLDTSAATNGGVSSLSLDQVDSSKPKVPNVTLEVVNGNIDLDDQGSKAVTFDYPELLTGDELKAYEDWLKNGESSNLDGWEMSYTPGGSIDELLRTQSSVFSPTTNPGYLPNPFAGKSLFDETLGNALV